jgi:hypothetical protein
MTVTASAVVFNTAHTTVVVVGSASRLTMRVRAVAPVGVSILSMSILQVMGSSGISRPPQNGRIAG